MRWRTRRRPRRWRPLLAAVGAWPLHLLPASAAAPQLQHGPRCSAAGALRLRACSAAAAPPPRCAAALHASCRCTTLLQPAAPRLAALELAPGFDLATDAPGGARGEVLWLDLDLVEQRYLLAAAGDGAIELYDVYVSVRRLLLRLWVRAAVCSA